MEAPGGWRDRGRGYDHEHWHPIPDDPETERIAGVVAERFAEPAEMLGTVRRLQALTLPDGRFVLVVSGGGIDPTDYETLQTLAAEVGASGAVVFVGEIEAS